MLSENLLSGTTAFNRFEDNGNSYQKSDAQQLCKKFAEEPPKLFGTGAGRYAWAKFFIPFDLNNTMIFYENAVLCKVTEMYMDINNEELDFTSWSSSKITYFKFSYDRLDY